MDPKTGAVAATEKSAQVTDKPQENEVKMTPQYQAREEIARRVEANRKEDIKGTKFDVLTDDGEIIPAEEAEGKEPEFEKTEDAEVVEQPEVEAKEEPAEEVKEEPKEEMRKVVVDGKEMFVPLSKILDAGVRTFQKETAADMRLAAASELERQARERYAKPEPQQEPALQPSDEDAVLAKAIQFGTEEEAKAAIAKLRNAARATTPQELRQFVQGSLASDIPQHLAFYEANRWVKNEYKEIFADPDLQQIFMNKEEMARKSGDQRPFADLYKDIAEDMSKKFKLREPTEESKVQSADRVIRKANAPKVPSSAAGRSPAPPERKAQTVSDYVQRQRELRGLQPLPKNQQGI